jgi:hypothetical protein
MTISVRNDFYRATIRFHPHTKARMDVFKERLTNELGDKPSVSVILIKLLDYYEAAEAAKQNS